MASLSIAKTDPLGWVIFATRIAALLFLLLFCLPPHCVWRLFRLRSPWPRMFLAGVARIAGAHVAIGGRRLRRDVFYVANHLSWIDIPVLAGATGTAFVAQDGIAKAPLVGWLASLNNTIFIARTDRLGIGTQIAALRDALDAHQPVAIFPEGTTTDGHSLLPFKPPLFAVMAPPPRPMMVQPVLLDYGAAAAEIAWVGEEAGDDNAIRVLKRRRGFRVAVTFLEPFDPSALDGRKAIAAEARTRIRAALSASLGGAAIV